MNLIKNNVLLLCCFVTVLASCDDDTNSDQNVDGITGSFDIIQTKMFEPNCVSCHAAGTSFAKQSDLILTKDVAYAQLVNRSTANLAAKKDELELVGTLGLESLAKSFLWEKINVLDHEHFYSDHPEYGALMPLGLPSLTNGELEYIRQWIVKGAPEEGFVADETLLDDETRFNLVDDNFRVLDLPAQGAQMHLGPFEVIPNHERELFEYQYVNNTEDIYVNQIEVSMRTGSHHFLLTLKTQIQVS